MSTIETEREAQGALVPASARFASSAAPIAVVALYSAAVAIACRVLDQQAIELGLRLQARLSFSLFVLALASPGLRILVPSPATAWLARSQDSLYRAFAVSHLVHGGWIVLYFTYTPAEPSWNVPDVSGVLAFPVIALLLVPWSASAARARVRLGAVIYVWIQFVGFFVDRIFVALGHAAPAVTPGRPELIPLYSACIALSVIAAVLARRGRAGPLVQARGTFDQPSQGTPGAFRSFFSTDSRSSTPLAATRYSLAFQVSTSSLSPRRAGSLRQTPAASASSPFGASRR